LGNDNGIGERCPATRSRTERNEMSEIHPIPGGIFSRSDIASSKSVILALVALVIFMDMLVYSIIIPVLPLYVPLIGVDESLLGIIFGVYAAMLFLFSIPMGLLSDRVGRLPLLVSGMLLLAAATFIFSISTTVPHLVLARAVQGISAAATWSAGFALLADISHPAELGRRMGNTLAVMGFGTILGPVAGGFLYENLGYSVTFLIPSILAGAIGLLILVIPFRAPRPVPVERISILPARGFLPFLLYAAVTVAVSGTYGILEPYLPVYLVDTFAASPTVVGVVLGTLALTSTLFQPIAGRIYDRYGGRLLIGGGLLLSGLVIIAAMQVSSIASISVIISLLGITLAFALVPMLPLMAGLYRSQGSQGMAYGVFNTFFSVGLAIGPFAGALLVTTFSLPAIFTGHALLIIAVGLASYLGMAVATGKELSQKG
jgi:DHA1 family multidrug resistance protein-like MFS transporter